jgi:hypothetical protein
MLSAVVSAGGFAVPEIPLKQNLNDKIFKGKGL